MAATRKVLLSSFLAGNWKETLVRPQMVWTPRKSFIIFSIATKAAISLLYYLKSILSVTV
jgi:hypothetical protein